MNNLSFRQASASDLREMQQLFVEAISAVCSTDYNETQIQAWTSGITDTDRWLDRLQHQFVLLATIKNQIVGYGTLKEANYIDLLFVHKDFQSQGIATAIYHELEEKAKISGSDHITSDVSITAKPFFEKHEFKVLKEQQVERMGVKLTNYKMKKDLNKTDEVLQNTKR
jgi:putative acetyltransferase